MAETLLVGGRTRQVTLERRHTGWRAVVDGEIVDVHAVDVDGARLSLVVGDGAGAGQSRVAVVVPDREAGRFSVTVDGRAVPVQVVSPERSRRRASAGADGSGPQRITAPMPGKVVRVLVKPGEVVAPRQGLVVVEAMKMENELRAAHGGRVASVAVVEGQSVDAGAVLAVVE